MRFCSSFRLLAGVVFLAVADTSAREREFWENEYLQIFPPSVIPTRPWFLDRTTLRFLGVMLKDVVRRAVTGEPGPESGIFYIIKMYGPFLGASDIDDALSKYLGGRRAFLLHISVPSQSAWRHWGNLQHEAADVAMHLRDAPRAEDVLFLHGDGGWPDSAVFRSWWERERNCGRVPPAVHSLGAVDILVRVEGGKVTRGMHNLVTCGECPEEAARFILKENFDNRLCPSFHPTLNSDWIEGQKCGKQWLKTSLGALSDLVHRTKSMLELQTDAS